MATQLPISEVSAFFATPRRAAHVPTFTPQQPDLADEPANELARINALSTFVLETAFRNLVGSR